jgi:hypothetical protein
VITIYQLHANGQWFCPFKQRYIPGDAKYSAKPLSIILTSIFTAEKTGRRK